jgi:hypothetical protein
VVGSRDGVVPGADRAALGPACEACWEPRVSSDRRAHPPQIRSATNHQRRVRTEDRASRPPTPLTLREEMGPQAHRSDKRLRTRGGPLADHWREGSYLKVMITRRVL